MYEWNRITINLALATEAKHQFIIGRLDNFWTRLIEQQFAFGYIIVRNNYNARLIYALMNISRVILYANFRIFLVNVSKFDAKFHLNLNEPNAQPIQLPSIQSDVIMFDDSIECSKSRK